MKIQKIYLAEEIKTQNATQLKQIKALIEDDVEIEFIPHSTMKEYLLLSISVFFIVIAPTYYLINTVTVAATKIRTRPIIVITISLEVLRWFKKCLKLQSC